MADVQCAKSLFNCYLDSKQHPATSVNWDSVGLHDVDEIEISYCGFVTAFHEKKRQTFERDAQSLSSEV